MLIKKMKNLLNIHERDYDFEKILKVPSSMRRLLGRFFISIPGNSEEFLVVASDTNGWEHVSISLPYRCPTWEEMVNIKDIFFYENEIVFQVHPHRKDYVNFHPYCLHLWRHHGKNVPIPEVERVINNYDFFSNKLVTRKISTFSGEGVIIFSPNKWSSWDTVCKIKHEYFGDDIAIQYNITKQLDLNDRRTMVLWKYQNNFPLPSKELI